MLKGRVDGMAIRARPLTTVHNIETLRTSNRGKRRLLEREEAEF